MFMGNMTVYRKLSHLHRYRTLTVTIVASIVVGLMMVKETVILVTSQSSGYSLVITRKNETKSQIDQPNSVNILLRDGIFNLNSEPQENQRKNKIEFGMLVNNVLQNRNSGRGGVAWNNNIRKRGEMFEGFAKPRKWETNIDAEAWHNNVSNAKWFAYYKQKNRILSPHKFKFIITAAKACARDHIDVVLTVHSHHRNRERRDVIRSTWASIARTGIWVNSTHPGKARVVFLFGVSRNSKENDLLLRESSEHGDIVQEGFNEAYRNLTLKSLMGLRWTSAFCSGARYLLKTDDDVFVHIPRLLSFIASIDHTPESRDSIYGRQNYPIHVLRSGKWGVSRNSYPFKRFPKYASGGGYLLNAKLAERLFNASKYFPQFPLEDIGVTGVLRMSLGLKLKFLPALIEKRYRYHSALCDMVRITDYVLVHSIEPPLMHSLFKTLATNDTGCPRKVRIFQPLRRFLRRDVPLHVPSDP